MTLTAAGLVEWAESRLGQGYVYGGYFDRIITAEYIERKRLQYKDVKGSPFYDGNNGHTYAARQKKWIGKYAGDCVGLIKSYYWFDGQKVVYGYQGRADTSADGMLRRAAVKGPIGTLPERPGVFLHFPGHISVYIGGGYLIESCGADRGVVRSKITEKKWTSWGEVPYLLYEEVLDDMLKKGSKGEDVRKWQRYLIQWDSKALPKHKADASFGDETETWTNSFLKTVGLKQTGQVGPDAWFAMGGALGDCSALEIEIAGLTAELKTANGKLNGIKGALDTLRSF